MIMKKFIQFHIFKGEMNCLLKTYLYSNVT